MGIAIFVVLYTFINELGLLLFATVDRLIDVSFLYLFIEGTTCLFLW